MPRVTALKINSVWSHYGHTFLSGDAEYDDFGNVIGYQSSCIPCGAEYVLRATPDAFSDGAYQANDGSEPTQCGGPTTRHGEDRTEEDHDAPCNCLLCDA